MVQFQESVSVCINVVFMSVTMMAAGAGAQNFTMFSCYGDVCNAGNTNQFCSERYQKCRDCEEVVDDCQTPKLPANCTSTCVKYLLDQALSKERGKPCHDLAEVDNGHHNVTDNRGSHPGTVVSYECDAGFRLIGAKEITCKEYGLWSKDPPVCEEITCNPLHDVINGKHNGSAVSYHKPGENVITQCHQGYQLRGDNITTCGSEGQWSSALPTCIEITCAPLPPVVNGGWTPLSTAYFKQWQNVTGSCHAGFISEGNGIWRCMESGWESMSNDQSMIHCIEPCSCAMPIAIAISLGVFCTIENIAVAVFFCKRSKSTKSRKFGRKDANFTEYGPEHQHLVSEDVPEQKVCVDKDNADHVKSDIYDNNTVSLNRSKAVLKKDEPALPSLQTVNEKPLKSANSDVQNEGLNGVRVDHNFIITVNNHVDNSNTNNNEIHNTNRCGSTSRDLRPANDIPNSSNPTPCKPETTNNAPSPVNDKYPVEEVSTSRQEQPEADVTHSSQESGAQGNNEQNLNQKLAINTAEVPMGDINGDSTAPNGILPKPHVVPSSAS